ncbi:MAG: tetratricopeptide repeat protein [Gemmatimonadaceae bacterium]|nr:tetratricopeptide repeat protein [Gemmatimonadaceae bacterium]
MRSFIAIAIALGGAVATQHGTADTAGAARPGGVAEARALAPAWEREYRADPADSLYRVARQTLNEGNNRRAAQLFEQLRRRYPDSQYVPDAMYWQAFALRRLGGERDLRTAQSVLQEQIDRFPDAPSTKDSRTLLTDIQGTLAKRGDADATQRLLDKAQADTARSARSCANGDDEDSDIRVSALMSLMQMNSEEAMPILKQVLARRDACSANLRRKAVFLVSQRPTSETESILLNAVRNDPDADVREQAVFWLSNVHSDRAVAALDSILRSSTDQDVQEKAIFALANTGEPRAFATLRDYAQRKDAPGELRAKAVFWLGQHAGRDSQNLAFLRTLFDQTDDEDIQNAIIQAMSQSRGDEANKWLLDVVQNTKLPVEVRKKALFWAGQRHSLDIATLIPLYSKLDDQDLKEHFIFVLSERREAAATDKLIDIAKNDKDVEMRKKALFWLAQKNDPRAKQLLMEIINQ